MNSIQWIQLLVALSFLVVIHEFGHFMWARIFKVRVEKFYIFFNPKFTLFKMKKWGGKWHYAFLSKNTNDSEWEKNEPDNTEWGIGWVPFGGYCAISGMVDETHNADQMVSEPQPWEFRSRKPWQRMLIILGGIINNFLGALIIFSIMMGVWGKTELPLDTIDRGLYFSDFLQNEGFRNGDRIISIDDVQPTDLSDILNGLIIDGKQHVRVQRGDRVIELNMPEDLGPRFLELSNNFDKVERQKSHDDPTYQKRHYILVSYYVPFIVDSVLVNHPAYFGGIEKGDSIVSVSGVTTPCIAMVQNELQRHACDSVVIGYYRAGEYGEARIFIGDHGTMGAFMEPITAFYEPVHTEYNILTAIPAGVEYAWDLLTMYVHQFRLVFTKAGAQSLGGFGAIGNMFPKLWDWYSFWHMTAFLSLILAFMNFLPIPALDGGYFLLILIEMITGRQLPDKWLERINNIGFWLLMILLIYANANDVFKAFF